MPKTVYAKRPKAEKATVLLRLPKDMLETCHALADKEHRSLQGQLLYLLERWMEQAPRSQAKDDAPARTGASA